MNWIIAAVMALTLAGAPATGRTVFVPRLLAAVLADGAIAIVDLVGYQVKILRSDDGSVRTVLGRAIQALPVTEQMREAAREREEAEGGTRVIASGPVVLGSAAQALSSELTQSLVPGLALCPNCPLSADDVRCPTPSTLTV